MITGNGGLLKPEAYDNVAPRTGYQPKVRSNSSLYAGEMKPYCGYGKEATVLKYYGDGTGRDSYVVKESGGMIPVYKSQSPENFFYSGLRDAKELNYTHMEVDDLGRPVKNRAQHWYQ